MSAVNGQSESWLNKLLSRQITKNEAAKESHSSMLSGRLINCTCTVRKCSKKLTYLPFKLLDKEILYALHTHNVRADSTQNYLEN